MDFIEFFKRKTISGLLNHSVFLRKLAVWIYKQIHKRKTVALVPIEVFEEHHIKEVQKLIKKNKKKDFFYIDDARIDIIRTNI